MSKGNKKIKLVLILVSIFIVLGISGFLFIKYFDFNKHFMKLELNGAEVVKINLNDEYKDEGIKAKFLWKDVKDDVKIEDNINSEVPGNYYVKYSYSNKLVNKTIERKVIVVDNIAPTLKLEKDKINIYVDGVIYPGKITAKDNIDGNISKKVVIDNKVDTKKPGTYKVKVSVSDSSGNTTSKDITVTIKEKPVKNGTVNARIDVYLSEQKLYYFEKNKLILTSDIVTGKKDGTPRGNYKVLRKKTDVTLVGKTFTDHVDYWIAFIGRLYGIHDATWRDKFGGDIFKTDGSHGCVNMPIDNMKKLYERVEVGTAVNIYD